MPVILTVADGQVCCRQRPVVRELRDHNGRSFFKLRQDLLQLIAIEHSPKCALRFYLNVSDLMWWGFEQNISYQGAKHFGPYGFVAAVYREGL
jgi:hypothetical protein